jgi:hypothetical protein
MASHAKSWANVAAKMAGKSSSMPLASSSSSSSPPLLTETKQVSPTAPRMKASIVSPKETLVISPLFSDRLPNSLKCVILSMLQLKDFLRLSSVNQSWYRESLKHESKSPSPSFTLNVMRYQNEIMTSTEGTPAYMALILKRLISFRPAILILPSLSGLVTHIDIPTHESLAHLETMIKNNSNSIRTRTKDISSSGSGDNPFNCNNDHSIPINDGPPNGGLHSLTINGIANRYLHHLVGLQSLELVNHRRYGGTPDGRLPFISLLTNLRHLSIHMDTVCPTLENLPLSLTSLSLGAIQGTIMRTILHRHYQLQRFSCYMAMYSTVPSTDDWLTIILHPSLTSIHSTLDDVPFELLLPLSMPRLKEISIDKRRPGISVIDLCRLTRQNDNVYLLVCWYV